MSLYLFIQHLLQFQLLLLPPARLTDPLLQLRLQLQSSRVDVLKRPTDRDLVQAAAGEQGGALSSRVQVIVMMHNGIKNSIIIMMLNVFISLYATSYIINETNMLMYLLSAFKVHIKYVVGIVRECCTYWILTLYIADGQRVTLWTIV